jgi:hypothetical protein
MSENRAFSGQVVHLRKKVRHLIAPCKLQFCWPGNNWKRRFSVLLFGYRPINDTNLVCRIAFPGVQVFVKYYSFLGYHESLAVAEYKIVAIKTTSGILAVHGLGKRKWHFGFMEAHAVYLDSRVLGWFIQ